MKCVVMLNASNGEQKYFAFRDVGRVRQFHWVRYPGAATPFDDVMDAERTIAMSIPTLADRLVIVPAAEIPELEPLLTVMETA